jgi:hypothetical protein
MTDETYKVSVWAQSWVDVEADSGEEAIEKAHEQADLGELEPAQHNALYEKVEEDSQCD